MIDVGIKIVHNVTKANLITSGGPFNADIVFSTVVLSKLWGSNVYRTEFNDDISRIDSLNPNALIYDVGTGKYGCKKMINQVRSNGIPYACAGEVWKDFGLIFLGEYCCPYPDVDLDTVWDYVDNKLFQGIDATYYDIMPKINYPTQLLSVVDIVDSFNSISSSSIDSNLEFVKAVAFASNVFYNILENAIAKAKMT